MLSAPPDAGEYKRKGNRRRRVGPGELQSDAASEVRHLGLAQKRT